MQVLIDSDTIIEKRYYLQFIEDGVWVNDIYLKSLHEAKSLHSLNFQKSIKCRIIIEMHIEYVENI